LIEQKNLSDVEKQHRTKYQEYIIHMWEKAIAKEQDERKKKRQIKPKALSFFYILYAGQGARHKPSQRSQLISKYLSIFVVFRIFSKHFF